MRDLVWYALPMPLRDADPGAFQRVVLARGGADASNPAVIT
jgi:hypothetical protein